MRLVRETLLSELVAYIGRFIKDRLCVRGVRERTPCRIGPPLDIHEVPIWDIRKQIRRLAYLHIP
jgi:hypothetical protein